MEYLLDQVQGESAAQVLGEGVTSEVLEEEIENLRATYYQVQFGGNTMDVDLNTLSRRAYLLATLASGPRTSYEPQVVGKALSVAAVIFEYLSEVAPSPQERINYTLNAILFYSRGEQEAQSATLARKVWKAGITNELASHAETQKAWHVLLLFLGREFRALLTWGRDESDDLFLRLNKREDGPFWTELLHGCLDVANALVWGSPLINAHHFDEAIKHARDWGNTRLTWLGLTVKEVVEDMVARSIRQRLTQMGMPGWASEALTMDPFVEMWLPHREAFRSSPDLTRGILSDEARISLINMPTSSGKSLIAEIAILFELTRNRSSKTIWVVPSRALVFEIQSRLSNHFRRIGIGVSSLPGGFESDPEDADVLSAARVFVLTPEKLDGLLRRKPDLLGTVRIVVVDEMHKIGGIGRGWLLETVVAWLLLSAEQNPSIRLLFMSAVLPNRPDFEVWLGQLSAGFVSRWATWRPTRLALFETSRRGNRQWRTTLIQLRSRQIIATHTQLRHPTIFDVPVFLFRTLRNQRATLGSSLVFFYTKDDVNAFVGRLSQEIPEPNPIPPEWAALSAKFEAVYGPSHQFPLALKRGVGIDHGDIPMWLRQLVETAFRSEKLPTLVANQAILEGVNFPIDDIIIGSLGSGHRSYFRFRLRLQDFSNLVGRVGRALVDTEGRCFLVWNWFYESDRGGHLSWDVYSNPMEQLEDVHSTFASNERELIRALTALTSSLEGIDEPLFDELGAWRDRLERLHSFALAVLELAGSGDYSRLSRWIQKTLAWQELGHSAREALNQYAMLVSRRFEHADRELYRLASLSGLSVRSANDVRMVAREIIDHWSEGREATFDSVFTPERFNTIVNLRECWRRHPVTYGTRHYIPRIDHYAVTTVWISGRDWTEVAEIIYANHQNLQERTRSGLVAAYVSQMFEFRLPWALGALAIAAKELGAPQELLHFLETLPSYLRYGVNMPEAVTICKLCRAERSVALLLAQKFFEQNTERQHLKTWLQHLSTDELQEWLPFEPDLILRDLSMRLHGLRKRDWTLRRDGRVVFELAGWRNYKWSEVVRALRSNLAVELVLRPEPDNPYDHYAVAVDAQWNNEHVHAGYVPASHSEEVLELLDWGRSIEASVLTDPSVIPPRVLLRLLDVSP